MARCFPERPPGGTPDSERRVFEALQSLPDLYAVFHSVSWHRDRGKPDGEADFLIAHPDLGFLVVEVKGGGIGFDAARANWSSRDRFGAVNPIHDPFDQAVAAKHALLNELRIDPRWPPRRRVQMGYAVVLPDTPVTGGGFTPRGKPEITFGKNHMADLAERITRCLEYWIVADPGDPPGREGVQAATERWGKSWSYAIPLREAHAPEEHRIVELTDQQMEILYTLERQNRAAIAGCAGSGKTLIAVAKARELAASGKSVLLTCFNRPLADHWNATLDLPPGIVAQNFHALCAAVVRQSGMARPVGLSEDSYMRWLPSGLYEALGSTALRFDAIIADEGQDFETEWFEYLDLLLADEEAAVFYTFYDDNQRLYSSDAIPRWFGRPYMLTRNVRNTNEIGSIVQRFYAGDMRLSGVDGPEVRVQISEPDSSGMQGHLATLGTILRDLRVGGADPADVVVLTPRRKSLLMDGRVLGGWRLRTRDQKEGHVLVETIHSFKGQDRSIVILTELDDLSEMASRPDKRLESLLYVGCSRARVLLVIIAPPALAGAIQA